MNRPPPELNLFSHTENSKSQLHILTETIDRLQECALPSILYIFQ